jgi:hypothetical protein
LQGCLNTKAKSGTIFSVPFVVHDNAVPANFVTVIRTVTMLPPCPLGFNYCEVAPHCSEITCEQRALLLGVEAVDAQPPAFTFAHPEAGASFVVPYGQAWPLAFTLDPCTSMYDTAGCFLSAVDAQEGDVSVFVTVEQDLSGCGDDASCVCDLATAMTGQCFPHVYKCVLHQRHTDVLSERSSGRAAPHPRRLLPCESPTTYPGTHCTL